MHTRIFIPIINILFISALQAAPGGGLIADNTAGTQLTQLGSSFVIQGGTGNSGNLLHSFREFNVETGQTADFRAAPDTQHIISRVTGNNDSWIDGKIKSTTSEADIYLINPNGMVFGKNAHLDVGGAFHASTADYVISADGNRIYADPNHNVTLTVAAPEAFGFLDNQVGPIQVEGSDLSLGFSSTEKATSLIGGKIQIKPKPDDIYASGAQFSAPGGNINIVGVAAKGEVPISSKGATTQYPTQLADITIENGTLSATSTVRLNNGRLQTIGSGHIHINGDHVIIEDSLIYAANEGPESGQGIELQAQTQLHLTRTLVSTANKSSGSAGDISLQAPQIILDARKSPDSYVLSQSMGLQSHSSEFPWWLDRDLKLKLELDIQHTSVDDLIATLTSPAGTELTLFNQVGGSGDHFVGTTFQDWGEDIRTGNAPFLGTYHPEDSFNTLHGEALDGTWQLAITDTVSGNPGQLQYWSIVANKRFPAENMPLNIVDHNTTYSNLVIQDTGLIIGEPMPQGQAGSIRLQATQQIQVWQDAPASIINAQAPADQMHGIVQLETPELRVNGAPARQSAFRLEQGIGHFERNNLVLKDSTGSTRNLTGPDYQIPAEVGKIQGTNLFHSFSEFNLADWESATFSGPSNVQHIIARVQDTPSTLNGKLYNQIPESDLWLINPAGIILGETVSLELGGALHLSTADYVKFTDGTQWNVNSAQPSALSITTPAILGFSNHQAGAIQLRGVTLDPGTDKVISLIGGEIKIDNAVLQTESGHINLVGVASATEVSLHPTDNVIDTSVQHAPVTLTKSRLITDGTGGGRISIVGDQLTVEDSILSARTQGTDSGLGITLQAQTKINLTRSLVDTRTEHEGNAGDIQLQAPYITLDIRDADSDTGLHSDSTAITEPTVHIGKEFALELEIQYPHSWGLSAILTSPKGTEIALFNDNGSYYGEYDQFHNITFSEGGNTSLDYYTSLSDGVFRPQTSYENLEGESLDGTWQLTIQDDNYNYFPDYPLASGQLKNWSIRAGNQSFTSGDNPSDIVVDTSMALALDIQNTELTLSRVLSTPTPGQAGTIQLQATEQIQVLQPHMAPPVLTAQAATTPGIILIDAPELRVNDAAASVFHATSGIGFFGQQNVLLQNNSGNQQPPNGPNYHILPKWGHQQGNNLFHNFSLFNLESREQAIFSGPDDIRHVIAQVQGPASVIDGKLRSEIEGADVWLINPSGIIFGGNATLDLAGALHLSTADYLRFTDNTRLYADTTQTPVFSTTAPAAFGFTDMATGAIQIQGSQLSVDLDQAIHLVGGEISLTENTRLQAPDGIINLVGTASSGEVQPGTAGTITTSINQQAPVILTDSTLDVDGPGGGHINITGHQITLQNSTLAARTEGTQPGLGIELNAQAELSLIRSLLDTRATHTGHAGDIQLQAPDIYLDTRNAEHETGLHTSSQPEPENLSNLSGQPGNIYLQATQRLEAWHEQPQAMLTARARTANQTHGTIQLDTPVLQVNGSAASDSMLRILSGAGYFSRQNIIVHNSSGTEQRPEGSDYQIPADWGMIQGNNLFHSFATFNLDAWESVTFNGPSHIQHIIARVLSTDSAINGQLINTIPDTDLWLINPAGISFGNHANLRLSGALHLSTADYVRFTDDSQLQVQLSQDAMLSAADPIAFGFLDQKIAPIQIQGSTLKLQPGNILDLVGGEIHINPGPATENEYGTLIHQQALLKSEGGEINLIAVASPGEAYINDKHKNTTQPADISITHGLLNVANQPDSQNVGSIFIQGDQVTLSGGFNPGSAIVTSNQSIIPASKPGIEILSDNLSLNDFWISSGTQGPGVSGSIKLQAIQQIMLNNAYIIADAYGQSDSGADIILKATDIISTGRSHLWNNTTNISQGGSILLEADNEVRINAGARLDVMTYDTGAGGNLTVKAADIMLTGAEIQGTSNGQGDGGTIRLIAEKKAGINNTQIVVNTTGEMEQAGDGGNLFIQADEIILSDNAIINAETTGTGSAGKIQLYADKKIDIDNSKIATNAAGIFAYLPHLGEYPLDNADQAGDGGTVTLFADTINLINQSRIEALAKMGSGSGGDINLQAEETLLIDNSSLIAHIRDTIGDTAYSGSVIATANNIITSDATLDTSTTGTGHAESITLKADADLIIYDSHINAKTDSDFNSYHSGQGGNAILQAENILISDTRIDTTTSASGAGGSVKMTADNQIIIDFSTIEMETSSLSETAGKGGSLTVQSAKDITFTETSIATETNGYAQGGSVTLNAGNQVISDNSNISLDTKGTQLDQLGNGGNFILQANDIKLTNGARISTATSGAGQSGTIHLQAKNQIDLSGQKTLVSSSSHGPGAAGLINLQATSLSLAKGADIQSSSGFNQPEGNSLLARSGAAGDIVIDLDNTLYMSGNSTLSTSTAGVGKAGDIWIGKNSKPNILQLAGNSLITSDSELSSSDAGSAGNITILTDERIVFRDDSILTTASQNAGGGGIRIETRDLLHLQNSRISTSVAGGAGQGGNIDIDPIFIILENSQIQANAHGGPGGNITLIANYLLRSGPSVIEASSELSTDGVINQQAVEIDGSGLQAAADIKPLNVEQWQPTPCHKRNGKISRLIIAGYDAHPTPVDDLLSSLPLQVIRSLKLFPQSTQQTLPFITLPIVQTAKASTSLTLQSGYQLVAGGMNADCVFL